MYKSFNKQQVQRIIAKDVFLTYNQMAGIGYSHNELLMFLNHLLSSICGVSNKFVDFLMGSSMKYTCEYRNIASMNISDNQR